MSPTFKLNLQPKLPKGLLEALKTKPQPRYYKKALKKMKRGLY